MRIQLAFLVTANHATLMKLVRNFISITWQHELLQQQNRTSRRNHTANHRYIISLQVTSWLSSHGTGVNNLAIVIFHRTAIKPNSFCIYTGFYDCVGGRWELEFWRRPTGWLCSNWLRNTTDDLTAFDTGLLEAKDAAQSQIFLEAAGFVWTVNGADRYWIGVSVTNGLRALYTVTLAVKSLISDTQITHSVLQSVYAYSVISV